MTAQTKLALGAATIVGTMAYVAYLAASTNWQYYVRVEECVAQADQWRGKRLRVSGRVSVGSLRVPVNRRGATFILEENGQALPVTYVGLVPDNLAEGKEVLVEGKLPPEGSFQAETLITRCASKYVAEEGASPPTGSSAP